MCNNCSLLFWRWVKETGGGYRGAAILMGHIFAGARLRGSSIEQINRARCYLSGQKVLMLEGKPTSAQSGDGVPVAEAGAGLKMPAGRWKVRLRNAGSVMFTLHAGLMGRKAAAWFICYINKTRHANETGLSPGSACHVAGPVPSTNINGAMDGITFNKR